MNIKKIIIGILILGTIGAVVAYKIYNKPHIDVTEASVDITISANKILNEFSSDEAKANSKYLEKIIEVEGVVSETKNEKGKGIVTLKTNDDFGSILCHLSEKATSELSAIQIGESITIKGICTGYLMDVILIKAEIIN